MTPNDWMAKAIELAEQAAKLDEVPVGAIVVLDGKVIGEGFNRPISGCDPTAHAEIVALRDAAAKIGNYRLTDADLYVTIEPCSMCAGAIVHSRIRKVYYGALEPKAGVAQSQQSFFTADWLNHQAEIEGGVLAEECTAVVQRFFKRRRAEKKAEKQARKLAKGED